MEWCVGYLYHVKPILICHLITTMRGSYNTGAAPNLNMFRVIGVEGESSGMRVFAGRAVRIWTVCARPF